MVDIPETNDAALFVMTAAGRARTIEDAQRRIEAQTVLSIVLTPLYAIKTAEAPFGGFRRFVPQDGLHSDKQQPAAGWSRRRAIPVIKVAFIGDVW